MSNFADYFRSGVCVSTGSPTYSRTVESNSVRLNSIELAQPAGTINQFIVSDMTTQGIAIYDMHADRPYIGISLVVRL